jgi:hypothetical protein
MSVPSETDVEPSYHTSQMNAVLAVAMLDEDSWNIL